MRKHLIDNLSDDALTAVEREVAGDLIGSLNKAISAAGG